MTSLISGSVDISKINDYFKNIQNNYDNIKKSILEKAQVSLLHNIQRLAPRKTGDYANSWKLEKITEDGASIVTPMGKLFILLEFTGAAPQKRRRKPPEKPYVFKTKSGETVFTFKVDWPGFEKIPHALPALKLTFNEIPEILKEELEKII